MPILAPNYEFLALVSELLLYRLGGFALQPVKYKTIHAELSTASILNV